MPSPADLLGDPWVRGCAVVGGLLLAVQAIVGLPWVLWLAWAYVVVLSVVDARRVPTRDTPHTARE